MSVSSSHNHADNVPHEKSLAKKPKDFSASMSLLFTSVFSVSGIFVMFYSIFLNARGLSTQQIGYAMSAMALSKIISVLVVAFFIDKSKRPHLYLVCAAFFSAFIMACVYFSHITGWLLIPLTFLFSLAWSMNVPLSEGFAMRACRLQENLNYGRVRLFGSISFLLAGIAMGTLISQKNDYGWFLVGVIVATIITGICGLVLPNFYKLEKKYNIITPDALDAHSLLKMLMSNLPLMVVILGASVMHAGHVVLFQYAPVAWEQHGYSGKMISYFMSIGVVAEVILFWFAGGFEKKFKTVHYFIIAGIGSCVRWFAMGFNPSQEFIFFFQCFHALTFGVLHLGVMRYIRENLSGNYHGAAQLIYGGMMWGVVMIPASSIAGFLCEAFGLQAYFFMSFIAFVGTVIVLLPFVAGKNIVTRTVRFVQMGRTESK